MRSPPRIDGRNHPCGNWDCPRGYGTSLCKQTLKSLRATKKSKSLALRLALRHSRAVTGRPCKPDDDMKRIWKLLLPDTPFPACGVSEGSEADAVDKKEPARDSDTASPVKRATPRR